MNPIPFSYTSLGLSTGIYSVILKRNPYTGCLKDFAATKNLTGLSHVIIIIAPSKNILL